MTAEVQASWALVTMISDGQETAGNSESTTVIAKEHRAELPAPSVAVQFTVVVPTGKKEPGGGVQTRLVISEQVSVTVGKAYRTTAPHW